MSRYVALICDQIPILCTQCINCLAGDIAFNKLTESSMYIVLTLIFPATSLPRMTSEPSVSGKPDSLELRRNSKGSKENLRRDPQGNKSESTSSRRQSRELKEKRKSRDLDEAETSPKVEKKETEISNYDHEPKPIQVQVQVGQVDSMDLENDRRLSFFDSARPNTVTQNKVPERQISLEGAKPKLKELAKYSEKDFSRSLDGERRQTKLEAEPIVAPTTAATTSNTVQVPVEVAPPVVDVNGLPQKGSDTILVNEIIMFVFRTECFFHDTAHISGAF